MIVYAMVCILGLSSYSPAMAAGPSPAMQYAAPPAMETVAELEGEYGGPIGGRLEAITGQWLIPAPLANPMMVEMFRTRDRVRDDAKLPWTNDIPGDVLPWSGEFAGKHLLSAQLVHGMTGDPLLGESIDVLVRDLVATQGPDGYLGPFPSARRFDNAANWDYWGHYHCIEGLLMYYGRNGWTPALQAAMRAADLVAAVIRENETPLNQMNAAMVHGFALLYRWTGERRYLDAAELIVGRWTRENDLRYITLALEGTPVVEFPEHRWESAHDWQGIAELYLLTGDGKYRRAYEHIWRDCLQGDRHNTGGWTSGEGIQNNPFHQGAIETCCTVAWIAMSIDMLRITGDPLVADELELSTWNGMIGGMHPSGRWWTYNTPMDGAKRGSTHDITFQARSGSPELNCCSVNAPRGLGMIHTWAVMCDRDGIVLNWYGPGRFTVPLEGGGSLIIDQDTSYPVDGDVRIVFGADMPVRCMLKFRIPSWSADTAVAVNGKAATGVKPGSYFILDREWRSGDTVQIRFDMSPHFWVGERECDGLYAIYRGPLLLAWDQRFNTGELKDIPPIDGANLRLVEVPAEGYPEPIVAFRVENAAGSDLVLCDFATAGMRGNLYKSWLPVSGLRPPKAASGMPVWTAR